uniref:Saposin B-type domain-containing protein n=1 Tax=Leersia perrieri TaxID=77586 RepID=A0A0D9UX65_9ORYZ
MAVGFTAPEKGDSFNILDGESLPLPSKTAGLISAKGKLCQLCEQYLTEALFFLQQNETQSEILSVLHQACAHLAPLKQQCITLVDYYIPRLFLEASVVEPENFCESVHFCRKRMMLSVPTRGDMCDLCQHVLDDLLTILRDPDMQLEIIELLLQTCNTADNYVQQCKMMVRKYVLLILVKTRKFLETTDVCSVIHACKTGAEPSAETMHLSAASSRQWK